MSRPSPELTEAMQRFENSAFPDVIVVSLRWPELAAYLDALRSLTHQRGSFALNESIEAEVSRGWNIARLLRTSLISPDDPNLGLTEIDSWPEPISGELGQMQDSLRIMARRLLGTENPGVGALQGMINRRDGIHWPSDGLTRVVVPTAAISGTEASLTTIETPSSVQWDVCNLSEAKRKDSCAITLLPGSPELSVGWREPVDLKSQIVSWLFNAPMSKHVILLRWPGSVDFDSNNYEPGRNSQVLDPRFSGDRDLRHVVQFEDDFSLSTSNPPRRRAEMGGEPVDSIDFQLPDGYWISYGVKHGPEAMRIDEDAEFEIEIEKDLKATKLRRGNTLVVLESTADRALRRQLSHQRVVEQGNPFSPEEAQAAVDAYKAAICAANSRNLISTLQRRNLPDYFIRSQIHRAYDPNTIAPKKRENLQIIADAVGFDLPSQMWDFIRALRGGYIYAGTEIRDRLKLVVAADPSWQDTVAGRQIARLEVPNLGVVWLAPILRVSEEVVQRHIGELGELIKT
jgi:hypothetical protein